MPLAKRNYEEDATPATPDVPTVNPNPDAPMTEEAMTLYLIDKLSSNYKTKFKTRQAPEINVFSVSQLTSGPGTALGYRARNAREASGEEPLVFNTAMFRGSAIHKYTEEKLPDWFPYETTVAKHKCPECGNNHAVPGTEKPIYVRETFEYKWKDGMLDSKGQPLKDLVIYGHPDFTKDNMVLELKTIESKQSGYKCIPCNFETYGTKEFEKHIKPHDWYKADAPWITYYRAGLIKDDRQKYVDEVVKKAKFQVGCYARILGKELKRRMFAYVVVIDHGLKVHLLSEDEMWHGYNFVRWCVYECAKRLENPQEEPQRAKAPAIANAEKGHLGNGNGIAEPAE